MGAGPEIVEALFGGLRLIFTGGMIGAFGIGYLAGRVRPVKMMGNRYVAYRNMQKKIQTPPAKKNSPKNNSPKKN